MSNWSRGRPSIADAFAEDLIPVLPPEGTGPGPPVTPDDQPLSGESAPPERAVGAPAPESLNLNFKLCSSEGECPLLCAMQAEESQPWSELSTPTERPGGAPAPASKKKKKKKKKKKNTVWIPIPRDPTSLEALLEGSGEAEAQSPAEAAARRSLLFARTAAFRAAGSLVPWVIDEAVGEAAAAFREAAAYQECVSEVALAIFRCPPGLTVLVETPIPASLSCGFREDVQELLELVAVQTASSMVPLAIDAAVAEAARAARQIADADTTADAAIVIRALTAALPATPVPPPPSTIRARLAVLAETPPRTPREARICGPPLRSPYMLREVRPTLRYNPDVENARPQHAHKAVPAESGAAPTPNPTPNPTPTTKPSSTSADRAPVPNAKCPFNPQCMPPKDLARDPAVTPPPPTTTTTPNPVAPTPPSKPPNPNRSPTSRRRRRRPTPEESSSAPPSSPKRRRRRRRRRSKAATEAPGAPHASNTRRRRRRRRRRRSTLPTETQPHVERPRSASPRADAPPFNPKQEEQPDHAGEDDPYNRKTPIWLPSARVLVDTVTGLQFLFFAYPDGRLNPAQDVTHHHRGYHTRPSTMPAHGRTAL